MIAASKIDALRERIGVVARASVDSITVLADDARVGRGDLFLVPSRQAAPRVDLLQVNDCCQSLRRPDDPIELAKSRIGMPDAWSPDGLAADRLTEVDCSPLLSAELHGERFHLHSPRCVPDPFADVYRVVPGGPEEDLLREILERELEGDLAVGRLRAGTGVLPSIVARLPVSALASHLAILGRTGTGKSHATLVLMAAAFAHAARRRTRPAQALSMLVLDPHDEYTRWQDGEGACGGLLGLARSLEPSLAADLAEPFVALCSRDANEPLTRRLRLSRADVLPADVAAVLDFEPLPLAFAEEAFLEHGERWIDHLRRSAPDTAQATVASLFAPRRPRRGLEVPVTFHEETVAAVLRRLSFLGDERSRLFAPLGSPATGSGYRSDLVDLLAALEAGRVLAVETTLVGELEQCLLASVIARTLFTLRRLVRGAAGAEDFWRQLAAAFGRQPSLHARLEEAVGAGRLPYLRDGKLVPISELPIVAMVVEEAPTLLGRDRLRPGVVFRELARQGRKFGLGLVLVSQQVRALDGTVLAQTGAEILLSLGTEDERRAAVEAASVEIPGGAVSLRSLGRGEGFLCCAGRRLALPIAIPSLDDLPPLP
jgi:DNA helicase HerA-like ATPase